MTKSTRTHTQRLDDLQSILRDDYGHDFNMKEVSEIAEWLMQFYTSLIKLAAQRRVAEHETAELKALLDNSQN